MNAIVPGRQVGIYCSSRLGDEPGSSSNGCRFYVYVGRTCEAWLDYHDLDTAMAENPGEPIFDRVAMTADLLELNLSAG
jgi:hypothetical protein